MNPKQYSAFMAAAKSAAQDALARNACPTTALRHWQSANGSLSPSETRTVLRRARVAHQRSRAQPAA